MMVEKNIKKRVYLDVCTLCRPYDDQSQMRVKLETDAVYLILQYIQNERYAMIVSPVHFKEVEATEDTLERIEVSTLLHRYGHHPSACDVSEIRKRAEQLYAQKIGIADAAHVAFAEATSDVFLTCDDRLLKKCRKVPVQIPTMNPVEFCVTEDLR